jgi:hypothetical protein
VSDHEFEEGQSRSSETESTAVDAVGLGQPNRLPQLSAAVLQLQASGGNRAVASLLHREQSPEAAVVQRPALAVLHRQQTDVPHKGEATVPDPSPARGPLLDEEPSVFDDPTSVMARATLTFAAAKIAADHYDHPLHKELVYHYVFQYGRPFALDQSNMTQVIAVGSKNLNLLGGSFPLIKQKMPELEKRVPQMSDPSSQVSDPTGPPGAASEEISDQAVVGCDGDKPSLGRFTVTVKGTLTARANPDTGATMFEFSGTMRWFDVWDFDPDLKAKVNEEVAQKLVRTTDAERGVRLAHDYLPGTPFNVDTEDVAVSQKTGDTGAQW